MYRRIRDFREDQEQTQQRLAGYLNVTQATYSRYESGELDIPTQILRKLALHYNTSADYLLELTDEKRPYPRKG